MQPAHGHVQVSSVYFLVIFISFPLLGVLYFICSMKILKSLLQFGFIAQCDHLFQVFIYLHEKGSY